MLGVILAGGSGTRLAPITEVINKHLLPVGYEPMVFHPVRKLVEAGIDRLLIVTGGNCPDGFLSLVKDGKHLGAKSVYYAYQQGSGGIAAALKLAKNFIGKEDFSVILGDNIFLASLQTHTQQYSLDQAEQRKLGRPDRARIFLSKVLDPSRFGCPEFDTNGKLIKIIEKPKDPPSQYAVIGVYFYPASVFEEVLPSLKPSVRGEYEVTDINNYYLSHDRLDYSILDGLWSDAGTWPSLQEANQILLSSLDNKVS
ncbi:spore coat protein [Candidatus Parcubacteria bacterium]|nr:MAG: spore coat protein [Candidatus Parcubacteria bacterium]